MTLTYKGTGIHDVTMRGGVGAIRRAVDFGANATYNIGSITAGKTFFLTHMIITCDVWPVSAADMAIGDSVGDQVILKIPTSLVNTALIDIHFDVPLQQTGQSNLRTGATATDGRVTIFGYEVPIAN